MQSFTPAVVYCSRAYYLEKREDFSGTKPELLIISHKKNTEMEKNISLNRLTNYKLVSEIPATLSLCRENGFGVLAQDVLMVLYVVVENTLGLMSWVIGHLPVPKYAGRVSDSGTHYPQRYLLPCPDFLPCLWYVCAGVRVCVFRHPDLCLSHLNLHP